MVAASELAGPLDGQHVLGFFDDTDDGRIAARIAADPALVALGDVAADSAEADLVLHPQQRAGESLDIDRFGGEQVKRDALSALRTDAG